MSIIINLHCKTQPDANPNMHLVFCSRKSLSQRRPRRKWRCGGAAVTECVDRGKKAEQR